MKNILAMTILLAVGSTGFAYAANDEFGRRFDDRTPTALEEEVEGGSLQDIEPAAGEAAESKEPSPESRDPIAPEPATANPVDEAAEIEQELEDKMGTDVSTTTQDLGDGQLKQHDSVGEGNIRAFYRSEQDGRVMDNSDAAGVEVKVLEFD